MGRRTTVVTITAEGRDKGREYLVTEMPASKAERWAARALTAVGKSGAQIPEDVANLGMAGLSSIGVRAILGVQFSEAEPLMDEMMGCVQRKMDSGVVRDLIEDDIEEVATRVQLRGEVLALHMGFSLADALSRLRSLGPSAEEPAEISSATPTSPQPSE